MEENKNFIQKLKNCVFLFTIYNDVKSFIWTHFMSLFSAYFISYKVLIFVLFIPELLHDDPRGGGLSEELLGVDQRAGQLHQRLLALVGLVQHI